MADVDGFCLVSGKKARKAGKQMRHSVSVKAPVEDLEHFDVHDFKQRLDCCIEDVVTSQFFQTSYENILSATSTLVQEMTSSGYNEQPRPGDIPPSSQPTAPDKSLSDDVTSSTSDISHKNPPASLSSKSPEPQSSILHAPKPTTENLNQSLSICLESLSLTKHEPPDIHLLSYGIGNFTTCLIARYQLAYLLAVRSKIGNTCTQCCVYDPVFSNQEKLVLETYNCHVISDNEEGMRECTALTVAFLPHCGKALYNNLLWRNLATDQSLGLSRLILIGNSFSNILERTPKRVLGKTGIYILKLCPFLTEVHLVNTFTPKDVFNDLSIHYMTQSQLTAALQSIGKSLEKPVYEDDDVEFITK